MSKINEWKGKLPYGFEEFIIGLSNQKNLAIVSLLYEKGEMSIEQIRKELGLSDHEVNKHIKTLHRRAMIKTVRIDLHNSNNSVYTLYPFNKRVLKTMIDLFAREF